MQLHLSEFVKGQTVYTIYRGLCMWQKQTNFPRLLLLIVFRPHSRNSRSDEWILSATVQLIEHRLKFRCNKWNSTVRSLIWNGPPSASYNSCKTIETEIQRYIMFIMYVRAVEYKYLIVELTGILFSYLQTMFISARLWLSYRCH